MATPDRRPCPVCGSADGLFYKLGESKPVLPQHWSCRRCYVSVPKEMPGLEHIETARPAVKHSLRTVFHRDGSTSTKFTVEDVENTNETYQGWLKRMAGEDSAFVESVLAKRKAELFKAGKLTFSRVAVEGQAA